jgi:two-component system, cell cycle sensor histidine kinase and response regulator CckA
VSRSITIFKELTEENLLVEGDISQIQNALLNLGINARDAMGDCDGTITYSTKLCTIQSGLNRLQNKGLQEGSYACISVSDTGSGIPPEIREKIFEPFYTTKGEGKGTGMGLAAVKGTVESHKGTIIMETETGKGTTFTLYLPLNT